MWYDESIQSSLAKLDTAPVTGLTSSEANKRKLSYGPNELKAKKKKSIFQLFVAQLNDVLIYILLAAATISAFLGEISDAVIIAIVIILNAVIGVIQESKAEKALEALKKMSTPKAIVKRDGALSEIPSEEVVPGDIIVLDAGRYVPCDVRLIESSNLKIEESALTGESVPVEKDADAIITSKSSSLGDRLNMAFMSTLVTYGRGVGVVTATGMNTEIGKIAKMLDSEDSEPTPLQRKLEELGKYLGIGALAICALMLLVGLLQRRNPLDMFLTAISLAVAAIPEGLPAIVTIVLAMGVQKMINEHAIVRRLPAVETLGAVNVICSDKTGTMTQNKMTVVKFQADSSMGNLNLLNIDEPAHKLLLENLILCNDAAYSESSSTGDPTEIALLAAGVKFNLFKDNLQTAHPRINEIPFDSNRKLMTTINQFGEDYYVMTKGAIDNLLKISTKTYVNGKVVPMTDTHRENLQTKADAMSDEALRVLGAAYKIIHSPEVETDTLEQDLIFIGMVGMIDPPRLEVKDAILLCKKSGIRTIMITGDHKNTAYAIANELAITNDENQAIFGYELDAMSDEELKNKIQQYKVFARVSPEHKVRIVKALKANGNIVSMTGDGVNDAPSLKAADIGVAMGISGTDVAKGASDMILTDDNFSTIVSAIREGRNIFNNIKKSILFLLSCNVGEILSIFLSIVMNWPSLLKPIHILWVNLITDTFPALALGVDPGNPDVMKESPRDPKEGLMANGSGTFIVLNGLLIGILTIAAFVVGRKTYPDSIMHAQTMAFVVLSVSQLFHAFNLRHREKSIFQIGLFTNPYLVGSLIIGLLLQVTVIVVPPLAKQFKVFPLNLHDWCFVIILSIVPLFLNELYKFIKRMHK